MRKFFAIGAMAALMVAGSLVNMPAASAADGSGVPYCGGRYYDRGGDCWSDGNADSDGRGYGCYGRGGRGCW